MSRRICNTRRTTFPINEGEKIDFAEYRRSRADAALELGWTPTTSWQLSGTLEYGRDTARLRIGQPDFPNVSSTFGGIVLRAVYDDLDRSGFPTRGTRVDVSQELLLSQLGSTGTRADRARTMGYGAVVRIEHVPVRRRASAVRPAADARNNSRRSVRSAD